MVPRVLAVAEELCKEIAGFDPSLYSGTDCALLAEALSRTEKACSGARTRAAARAVACGAHKERGFADGADWLAKKTGTSRAEARTDLETAGSLGNMPATADALSRGEVSWKEAAEVARGEAASPGSEEELVELAKTSGLGAVKDEVRKRTLEAQRAEELATRQHRARYFRHWRDELGMVRFSGALPPTVGIDIANRVEAEAGRLRRAAGPEGREVSFEAHTADALVKMLQGQGKGPSARADLVVVVDLAAYRRGHAHAGETCHIVGGGPVTVGFARDTADDAFIKALTHDGVRIETVAHFGRHIPAELRTALELGEPPGFDGVSCTEPGCNRRYGLEWDHVDPVAHHGPTSYDNLRPRCKLCHWQKTERDRQAGLFEATQPP
ncbi:MAG: HNH endonuclease signature motif containing protein [Acidimicrobiales bacterium]